MITVILHGMPGDNGQQRSHQIPTFRENITVECVLMPGSDTTRAIGYNATPTKHTATFRLDFYDGTYYHYEFTGEIY